MLKRILLGLSAATLIALPLISSANARTYGGEMRQHTRTGNISHGRLGTAGHRQYASHNFGGYNAGGFGGERGYRGQMRNGGRYRDQYNNR